MVHFTVHVREDTMPRREDGAKSPRVRVSRTVEDESVARVEGRRARSGQVTCCRVQRNAMSDGFSCYI